MKSRHRKSQHLRSDLRLPTLTPEVVVGPLKMTRAAPPPLGAGVNLSRGRFGPNINDAGLRGKMAEPPTKFDILDWWHIIVEDLRSGLFSRETAETLAAIDDSVRRVDFAVGNLDPEDELELQFYQRIFSEWSHAKKDTNEEKKDAIMKLLSTPRVSGVPLGRVSVVPGASPDHLRW